MTFFPLISTATGIHRLRNTWPSLFSQLVDNYGDDNSADNPFLSTVKSSEIENKIVNAEEAEAMEADDKLFYAFIPFPEKC